jgi:hypothetical protein
MSLEDRVNNDYIIIIAKTRRLRYEAYKGQVTNI